MHATDTQPMYFSFNPNEHLRCVDEKLTVYPCSQLRQSPGNSLCRPGAYLMHVELGPVLAFHARKSGERHFEVVGDALAEYLVGAEHESGFLCINSLGRPWKIENSLQRSSSDYLTGFARKGIIEPGLTLHGLRVSFVSSIKRAGGDDRMVADPTGEQSISMGVRYTRHVVKEGNIAKVYDLVKQRQENEK